MYHFTIGELAYKMEKNWRRNQTCTLQFKITTPEFEKWKFVFKAFISIIRYRFPQSNCKCMVFSTFCTFWLQNLKNQLYDKALFQASEVWILALCFRDWSRYFYKVRNSMSSIRLNWETMFVQDGLST